MTARARGRRPDGDARRRGRGSAEYLLRLYVAGHTPKSQQALANLRRICEEHLAGRYELEVIDVFQQATRARDDQVIAIPTLIKTLPVPLKRFIGDLSNRDVVVVGLDVKRK